MHSVTRRMYLGLLLAVMATPHLLAQRTYSWEEIREKFRITNPTLLADEVNIDENRAQEITAFLRPNPDMNVLLDQFTIFKTPNTPWRPLADVLGGGRY